MRASALVTLGLLLIIAASPVLAADEPQNPDRYPSVGLTLRVGGVSGDSTVVNTASSFNEKQNISEGRRELELDGRFPVSPSLTLTPALTLVGIRAKSDETGPLDGHDVSEGGFILSLGMRYYFNH